MSGDIIPLVIGALVLASIVVAGITSYVNTNRRWDKAYQVIDEEYDLQEDLRFAQEMLEIARPSEVFEPDQEISRMITENRRLALKLQNRLLRRLLKKGPDPDAENDKT